jgi:hypothetical protein
MEASEVTEAAMAAKVAEDAEAIESIEPIESNEPIESTKPQAFASMLACSSAWVAIGPMKTVEAAIAGTFTTVSIAKP